ncbi:uncharacterized protein [Porites lutea]|uniref:uncharacterized protein isoform X1 n=1 Tax=Porites lutea TaxID=51062 RepID=UPI003CC66E38
MSCEPDYVANLKKYFNDLHNTGTYYKKITSKEQLESEAKDAFREFLGTVYPDWSDRFESFFNEWKMTYTSQGPFETEHDRANINDKMTHPDDFQTSLYIEDMLTNRDDAKEASDAYIEAFVSKDSQRVALFYLGDDDIMHGVMAAGVRTNMDAVFVVFFSD